MKNYYVGRITSAIFTLFLIATITFFMMHAIPGGPFTRERQLPPEIEQAMLERYHLDDPLLVQYKDYMLGLLTFDMGPSFRERGRMVNDLIALKFPTSAKIGLIAVLCILALAIPLGIISALKQNRPIDYLVMFSATLGVTIPSFVIATVFAYIFAVRLGWVPALGLTSWKSYIGPVIALSGYSLSFVTRLTRSSMLEVLRQDYIRTARANGIPEWKVLFKHALKNALIPVVTYVGPMIAAIITGSFVVEKIFDLNGLGVYFVTAVEKRDYTMIMGTTVTYAAIYVVMVLLVDVAYSFIDPRIRLGKKRED
ncbi:MAG: ABC transporter permease [Bacilli bacterium]|nr:ABC transporter permease [Bacilli bacterium]MBN2696895.1 ABC transporter permease [Bacilli bacterium]